MGDDDRTIVSIVNGKMVNHDKDQQLLFKDRNKKAYRVRVHRTVSQVMEYYTDADSEEEAISICKDALANNIAADDDITWHEIYSGDLTFIAS